MAAEPETFPTRITDRLLGLDRWTLDQQRQARQLQSRLHALAALRRAGILAEQALGMRRTPLDPVEINCVHEGYRAVIQINPPGDDRLAVQEGMKEMMLSDAAFPIAPDQFLECIEFAARTLYPQEGGWRCSFASCKLGHSIYNCVRRPTISSYTRR